MWLSPFRCGFRLALFDLLVRLRNWRHCLSASVGLELQTLPGWPDPVESRAERWVGPAGSRAWGQDNESPDESLVIWGDRWVTEQPPFRSSGFRIEPKMRSCPYTTRNRVPRTALAVCLVVVSVHAIGVLPSATSQAPAPEVVFGVVLDGWPSRIPVIDTYRDEITRLLGSEYNVRFPPEKTFLGGPDSSAIEAALDALFADPDVDVVLALGVLSSAAAAGRPLLTKPTVAPFVVFPELGGLPTAVRRGTPVGGSVRQEFRVSGRENLVYITIRDDYRPSIEAFLEVVPFRNLAVVVMQSMLDALPVIEERFRAAASALDLTVHVISDRGQIEDTVSRIPAEAEAVFVGPLLEADSDIRRLADLLIERGLPSFSMVGRAEVDQGLLASIYLSTDLRRTARRTAINVQRILEGEPAAELPVDFEGTRRLSINMATARAIDVRLSWATLTEAELLHDEERPAERLLSLVDVLKEAERVNLDLAAADRTVAAGLQEVRIARSRLRPQIEASGSDIVIDSDRAGASFGSQGKNQLAGSLSISQILYSEQVRAGYSVERTLQVARELERSQLRLDVILDAAQAYLDVLRTKTAERIRRQNLELTRRNLERARVRVELGAAGPGELYRWQSELANNRKSLIAASAVRNQAEIEVNRALNRSLEERFATSETAIDDPALAVNYETLRPYIDNQQGFLIFRRFLATRAIGASPEIGQFDRAIAVQERLLLASKRALYVPVVAAQAGIETFRNDGVPSAGQLGSALGDGFEFPTINSVNWTLGLQASLPLFQGGALRSRRAQARIELDELTLKREALRQRIEQRVRSSMHAAMASWAGIDLAKQAADAALSNFELVADGYSEGAVDIVTLLDAQRQSLNAELAAATAIYDFFSDMMAVQRSTASFDYFRSDEDRVRFLDSLRSYFKEQGYEP